MNIRKKAQNEIVGFVMIIVIVVVLGLIFLSFMIGRGEPSRQTSVEISNLLEASMYFTTDCAVSFVPQYKSVQDLIKSCYNDERCLDERNACDVLNSTMEKIISESLNVDENSPNKAYSLAIYYKSLDSEIPNEEILFSERGDFKNCSTTFGGSHSIYLSSLNAGTINIELEICN